MATQTHPRTQPYRLDVRGRASAAVDLRVPGLLLVALSAQFMTAIMLAASIAPGYDFHGGAISDLGAIPETALLFNSSLVTVGVLNLVAGYLFYRWHGRRWILATFGAAGIGAVGAGAIPLGTSDLHSLFALVAFVFFNLEALAASVVSPSPIKLVGFLAGAIGLAFVVVMVIGDAGNPAIFGAIGHGGAERMIAYPVMLWLVAFGGWLMAAPSAGTA